MLSTLLQTAAADALGITEGAVEAAPIVPVQQEMSYSMIELAAKGGWLMWVLLLLYLIALYIFGKKWWMIRNASKIDKNFINDIKDYISDGKTKSARSLPIYPKC